MTLIFLSTAYTHGYGGYPQAKLRIMIPLLETPMVHYIRAGNGFSLAIPNPKERKNDMSTEMTIEQLKTFSPSAKLTILKGIVDNQSLLEKYSILPGLRRQYFMAQIAHESDGFHTTKEYASGALYEGRKDLGNTTQGDGKRYKGRGLIQLTGKANYEKYGTLLGADLVGNPEQLEQFPLALAVATAFWNAHGLNKFADEGEFHAVTRAINGGLNGMPSRFRYLDAAQYLKL